MKKKFILMCVFFILIGLRLIHIEADPPTGLSFSAGIFVDQMQNIHQVRNKILFGSWKMDGFPSNAYSPLWALLQYGILSAIDVGHWQIKILPILLSIVTLIFVYKSFSEYYGIRYGQVAALLLGLNYTFIMYNRLGLFENLVIGFEAVALFFWQRAVKTEKAVYFFLTGASAGFVFIAKSLYFSFVIAAALTFIVYILKKGIKSSLRSALMGIAGASASGLVWIFGCYIPFHEAIARLGSSWVGQNLKPLTFDEIISTNPLLPFVVTFKFLPVTVVLSLLFICGMGYKFLNKKRQSDLVEVFLFFWLCCGLLFLGHLSYAPTRYYMPILPPVVLMAAILLVRFGSEKSQKGRSDVDLSLCTIIFLATFCVIFYIAIPYIDRFYPNLKQFLFMAEFSRQGDIFISVIIAMLTTLVFAASRQARKAGYDPSKVWFSALSIIVFFFSFSPSRPFHATIEIEAVSNIKSKMRFYWADSQSAFSEKASQGVHIQSGIGAYRTYLDSLNLIQSLRIDPIERQGEIIIKKVRISQPGFEPIQFQNEEDFKRFTPLQNLKEIAFQGEGLKVVTSGPDPQIQVRLEPCFSTLLLIKFIFFKLLFALGVGFGCHILYRIFLRLGHSPSFIKTRGKYIRRDFAANLLIILIILINMFHYAKWAFNTNYTINTASRLIGEMLPPDSLVAGVGVMAVTINNKLRDLQAPSWYEDNNNIFITYPITHLLISSYAGYLNWYQKTFPQIMEKAEIIGKYRILNIDFFLFKLNHR